MTLVDRDRIVQIHVSALGRLRERREDVKLERAFDGGIVTWQKKTEYDAVRPISAIRFLYGNEQITAWGGPGEGTVDDILGEEWTSYLDTADHPDYPSATACFCAAHAQANRRFLDTDDFGWDVERHAGSSNVEPGITPASDVTLSFPTFSDFEEECGKSRFWAGVHLEAAVEESLELCRPIGDRAYELMRRYADGDVACSRGRRGSPPDHAAPCRKGLPVNGSGEGPGKRSGRPW